MATGQSWRAFEGNSEGNSEGADDQNNSFDLVFNMDESGDFEKAVFDVIPAVKQKEDDAPVEDAMASSVGSSMAKRDWKKHIDELKTTDEMEDFVLSMKNVNTARKTKQVVNAFQSWLSRVCEEETPIEEMAPIDLDGFISNYLMMKKKKDGTEHEPDTLTSIHRGILRHLKDKKYPCNPLTDAKFEMSRDILASKRMKLKQQGKGNRPNKAEALDETEIETLWETGALGISTPRILQQTLYFFTNMAFGQRGSHEPHQMAWGDVEECEEADGTMYLEFTEKVTKTRRGHDGCDPREFPPKLYQTNDDRCPVVFYHMFKNRRPADMLQDKSPFYLTVHPTASIRDDIGYNSAPMGINTLNEIVKKVCKTAGVPGKKTNHSLRRTAIRNLLANDVPPVFTAQLSGHKNLNSLNSYSTATRTQQRAMSYIATGAKRKSDGLPAFMGSTMRPTTSLQAPSSSGLPALMGSSTSSAPILPATSSNGIPLMMGSNAPSDPSLLPSGTVALSAPNHGSTIERLAQSASGMFAHANVSGNINVTINYNVSSHASSSVSLSPVIPQIKDD